MVRGEKRGSMIIGSFMGMFVATLLIVLLLVIMVVGSVVFKGIVRESDNFGIQSEVATGIDDVDEYVGSSYFLILANRYLDEGGSRKDVGLSDFDIENFFARGGGRLYVRMNWNETRKCYEVSIEDKKNEYYSGKFYMGFLALNSPIYFPYNENDYLGPCQVVQRAIRTLKKNEESLDCIPKFYLSEEDMN